MAEQKYVDLLVVAFQGLPNNQADSILEKTVELVPVATVDQAGSGAEILILPRMFGVDEGEFFGDEVEGDTQTPAVDLASNGDEIIDLSEYIGTGVKNILQSVLDSEDGVPVLVYPHLEQVLGNKPVFEHERSPENQPCERIVEAALAVADFKPYRVAGTTDPAW